MIVSNSKKSYNSKVKKTKSVNIYKGYIGESNKTIKNAT